MSYFDVLFNIYFNYHNISKQLQLFADLNENHIAVTYYLICNDKNIESATGFAFLRSTK